MLILSFCGVAANICMHVCICEYVWRKGGEGNSNNYDDDTVARKDNHNNDNNETRYTIIMMILRIHRMSKK